MASFDGIDRSAEIPFDNVQVQENVTNNVLNTFLLQQRTQWDTSNIVSGETLTATNVQGPGVFRNDQIPWSLAPGDVITSLVVPYISSGEVRVPGSNIYGPIADTTATLDVSHLTGGLIDLSHLPTTLESTTIELAPNVKISTAYANSYYFNGIGFKIPVEGSFNYVPLPSAHTTEGSPNTPHTFYSGVTVCASNVAFSTLRDDVMPDYLRGTTTLASITASAPVSSTYAFINRIPPLYTDESSTVYTSNMYHLLPLVQVYGSNLAGFDVVTTQDDMAQNNQMSVTETFTATTVDGKWTRLIVNPLLTYTYTVPIPSDTTHNLFPTVSVLACNVIGGVNSHLREDTLPFFLTPVKTVEVNQISSIDTFYGNPVDNGINVTTYTSNVRYGLPLVEVKSENVHGDYLTVNSNITTSNFSVQNMVATTVKVQTNVQIVNGAVAGSYLNMTGATSSNIIAGYMTITGINEVPAYPEYFREFQAGQNDPDNPFSAEGDPGYGFFSGLSHTTIYFSDRGDAFTRDFSFPIELEKNWKSTSRYHTTRAFDDAQVENCYEYGWNNHNRVYPPEGYTYSLKTEGSIWSGNKLLLSSDERIKSDITPLNSNVCLLGLLCLKPSGFVMKQDKKLHLGFIAQQVKEYVPEAVMIGEGSLADNSVVPDFHTLDYNTLTTISVGAIQSLYAEIVNMRKEMHDLKNILKLTDGVP